MTNAKKISEMALKCAHCELRKGCMNGNYCRDCRYMEMENDFYNDGTRRCSYKGTWLRPGTPACGNFQY